MAIVLTDETYARLMRAAEWAERFSRDYQVQTLPASISSAGTSANASRTRWFIGVIVTLGPEGQTTYASTTGGNGAGYWFKSCFLDMQISQPKSARVIPRVHADDDPNLIWSFATNLTDTAGNTNAAAAAHTLFPGDRVLIFATVDDSGQTRYIITQAHQSNTFSGSTPILELINSADDAKQWNHQQIYGGPVDYTFDNAKATGSIDSYTFADGSRPDPRTVKTKIAYRFDAADGSNLAKLFTREVTIDNGRNVAAIGAGASQDIGTRITVVTATRLVFSNTGGGIDTITLEYKTREIVVLYSGTESAWTANGAGTLDPGIFNPYTNGT